jgi:hypothetical protein
MGGNSVSDVFRSADVLVKIVTGSPSYLADLHTDPKGTLERAAKLATESLPPPAYVTDRLIYRIVVGSLGIVAIAAIIGAIFLTTLDNKTVPDVLTALGAASIGALAGLLAPSPAKA